MEPSVIEITTKIVTDKSMSLLEYLEMMKPRILSDSPEVQEAALTEIVAVVQNLPKDFLTADQVSLLLSFLLARMESAALAGSDVIDGVKHLIFNNSSSMPAGWETNVFKTLFIDRSLQAWPQKDRMKQYEIFAFMMDNCKNELKKMDVDVILAFINAFGGERDPRCLMIAFQLFIKVANEFKLGNFAEDLFESVACYYPIEFKPLPGQEGISKDMLATACTAALVAHSSFAPYCMDLIVEKFQDEETTYQQKEEICVLLTKAIEKFSLAHIYPYLDDILGFIRSVALDPTNKGEVSPNVWTALSALFVALERGSKDKTIEAAREMLENVEPFILQAEMGLSKKAVTLLKALVQSSATTEEVVLDKTVTGIISLVQGTTVNAAANKVDITKEGLQYLREWITLLREHNSAKLLTLYESTIFCSLDQSREWVPVDSMETVYHCLAEYLRAGLVTDNVADRCTTVIQQGLRTVKTDVERHSFLSFIAVHSQLRWSEHLQLVQSSHNQDFDKLFDVLTYSIHDQTSWQAAKELLSKCITEYMNTVDLSNVVVLMTRLAQDNKQELVDQIGLEVIQLVSGLVTSGDKIIEQNNKCFEVCQDIALLLSEVTHTKVVEMVKLREEFRWLTIQSNNADVLLHALSEAKTSESQRALVLSIVNKTEQIDNFPQELVTRLWFEETVAKALILRGKGLQQTKTLFTKLADGSSTSDLNWFYDFTSRDTDPSKCRYVTTALWKQRVFCQTIPMYIEAVVNTDDKTALLSVLPNILNFANDVGPAVQGQLPQLLPVFVASLQSNQEVPLSVLQALQTFIPILSSTQLDPMSIAVICQRLSSMVNNNQMSTSVMALESLASLVTKASASDLQPFIATISCVASQALGHRKRIVRKKAAIVKNSWEMLATH